MKLRNKKTGVLGTPRVIYQEFHVVDENGYTHDYESLRNMHEEWEDYEEPKVHWYIYGAKPFEVDEGNWDKDYVDELRSIGNYFNTREEAELAVRKLKAWKRLKDKGFRFEKWTNVSAGPYSPIWFYFEKDTELKDVKADLDLLFGGGE